MKLKNLHNFCYTSIFLLVIINLFKLIWCIHITIRKKKKIRIVQILHFLKSNNPKNYLYKNRAQTFPISSWYDFKYCFGMYWLQRLNLKYNTDLLHWRACAVAADTQQNHESEIFTKQDANNYLRTVIPPLLLSLDLWIVDILRNRLINTTDIISTHKCALALVCKLFVSECALTWCVMKSLVLF